jgi:hypothetical protein
MEMRGQLHAPAILIRKEPPVLTEPQAGWTPEPDWTFWRSEKTFDPAESQTSNHPASA